MTNEFFIPEGYTLVTDPNYVIKKEDMINAKQNNGHKGGWLKAARTWVGSTFEQVQLSANLDVASFDAYAKVEPVMNNAKYVAIKLIGLKSWLWFETANVTEEDGRFIGKAGWGQGGAFTEVDVDDDSIESRLVSEALQY